MRATRSPMNDLTLPDGRVARAHREDDEALPTSLTPIDDRLSANDARKRLLAGEELLWTGDWHNGRQLLSALKRRVRAPAPRGDALNRWRAHRSYVRAVADLTGHVWVVVEPDGSVDLRRAPDTTEAVRWALGRSEEPRVVPLSTVVGLLGAAGWTRKGLTVPGVDGMIVPRFGVFSPTRHAYVGLLDRVDFDGLRVLDTGSGTGVLSILAAQRGAKEVFAIDTEPRALVCTRDNARRRAQSDRIRVGQHDLFWPDERVDLALFNPPWMPETPRTRLDRAVFDDGGLVQRWLAGLSEHLTEDGRGILLVSDLAERIGLREEGALQGWIDAAGLQVVDRWDAPAGRHKEADPKDPLAVARAAERVWAWVVRPGEKTGSAGEDDGGGKTGERPA